LGSGEAEWRRCLLGELAPDRSCGDNDRAGEGDLSASSDPKPGDMLEGVWGREPPDPLLYGSETARRRGTTRVSISVKVFEMENCRNVTHLSLGELEHQYRRAKASEAQSCSVVNSERIQH
jgi:hypothetical protein